MNLSSSPLSYSLYLRKHAINAYGEFDVFLTSTLDEASPVVPIVGETGWALRPVWID